MNRYRIYGLIIETEATFIQLEKAGADEGDAGNTIFIRQEKCADEVVSAVQKADAMKLFDK